MKRTVAKEFLLLVGCLVALLLVVMYGWIRNSWFEHRADSIGLKHVEQSRVLDSLAQLTVPRHLHFLDLFEPEFIRKNCSVFLFSPFRTMDAFLHDAKSFETPPALTEFRVAFAERSTVVQRDPLGILQTPTLNRRLMLCVAKALDTQRYLTPDRIKQLAAVCGLPGHDFGELERELRAATMQFQTSWKPPLDAEEVYTINAAGGNSESWIEALHERGVPKEELTEQLARARADTSIAPELLLTVRGLLCDTVPYTQLRNAFDYLKERHALRCNVDELLYTLQNKAIPPTREAFDAFSKQKTTVDELRTQQNAARANVWSAAKQWEVVLWVAIVLFVLVWPVRLLVVGTSWALRTVRS